MKEYSIIKRKFFMFLLAVFVVLYVLSGHALASELRVRNDKEELFIVATLELLKLINSEREKVGVHALKLNETMQKAANIRAAELIKKYSHDRPNGRSFSTVFAEVDLAPLASAENIAWSSPELDVATFHRAFMDSIGHRTNMLNGEYTIVGIGFSNKGNKYFVVELFADEAAVNRKRTVKNDNLNK